MRLFLPSSRWWCFNGGFNVVFVTPLWGVNDMMSIQWHGSSLLSYNVLLLIVSEWNHLRLAGVVIWTKMGATFVHCCLYGRVYNRDYQLPPIPRSSIFGIITGIWRVFFFFFFFFFFLRFFDLKFVGGFQRLWLWVCGGGCCEFVMGVWLNLIRFMVVVSVGLW